MSAANTLTVCAVMAGVIAMWPRGVLTVRPERSEAGSPSSTWRKRKEKNRRSQKEDNESGRFSDESYNFNMKKKRS